ncbi:hypothetical protein [Nonomuraea sp. NPDC003709]|uniref:hypothetical protein n=1 Tax=Nonomuraea sp. NPDC003709 TaxID=3154450 RepID=UPI0033BDF46B
MTVPNPLRPSDPVEIAAGACVLLANHLELLAHQLREQALDDFARDRLADAAERVRQALDIVTAAAGAALPNAPQAVAAPVAQAAQAVPPPRQAPAGRVPVTATIVTWTRPRQRREGNRFVDTGQRVVLKVHVSLDGSRTMCGCDIPDHATVVATTPDWHLHTNCYNCAYRLWPDHAPVGYIRPADSRDFPLRTECPHYQGRGIDAKGCVTCTPAAARNWPCPRGCADPADHDPGHRFTNCTVSPPQRPLGPDGRCVGVCESTDAAMRRANPGFFYDLADSAIMYCYHCGHPLPLWA